jgi:hypothetical protein
MPVLAVAMKPFSFFIPENTQYFGIYFAVCIILQGFIGYFIVKNVANSQLNSLKQYPPILYLIFISGAIFCMTAPWVINRFTAHTALSSQWLLLLSILVSIRWVSAPLIKWCSVHCAILFIATGINPYIAFLVGINFLVFSFFSRKKQSFISIASKILLLAASAIFGLWLFGFLTGSLPGDGYGYYSMNLLGPFDSNGYGLLWSLDVPDATGGQAWEGFSYLGFGLIVMIAVAITLVIFSDKKGNDDFPYYPALIVIFCVFALSLSNIITVGLYRISIPLPVPLLEFLSLFRASGRFFWLGNFWLIFLSLAVIIRRLNLRYSSIVILICALLQIIDVAGIANMTKLKINGYKRLQANLSPVMLSGKVASNLFIYPPWQCDALGSPGGVRSFEIFNNFAITFKIPINSFYAGRTPLNQLNFHCDFDARLDEIDQNSIYVINEALWRKYGDRLKNSHLC